MHERNLKQCEAKLGADHPDTLTSRNNLAAAYWSAGKLDRSIPLFEETLRQYKATLGPDHPDTLRILANLGVNYRNAGRLDDAIPLLENALHGVRKHPASLAFVPGALAETYERAGQFSKAEPLFRAALDQTRQRFGAEDTRTAAQMAVLGLNLLHQHKHADAQSLLRDSLHIREAKQPDAWTTFNTQSLLGDTLLGQKKYTDAEPLLLKGYQGMKEREAKIPSQGKVRLTEALERLVQLYDATGKKDEAAKWRKLLDETKKTAEKEKAKK